MQFIPSDPTPTSSFETNISKLRGLRPSSDINDIRYMLNPAQYKKDSGAVNRDSGFVLPKYSKARIQQVDFDTNPGGNKSWLETEIRNLKTFTVVDIIVGTAKITHVIWDQQQKAYVELGDGVSKTERTSLFLSLSGVALFSDMNHMANFTLPYYALHDVEPEPRSAQTPASAINKISIEPIG
jgi:hypothetical protein